MDNALHDIELEQNREVNATGAARTGMRKRLENEAFRDRFTRLRKKRRLPPVTNLEWSIASARPAIDGLLF